MQYSILNFLKEKFDNDYRSYGFKAENIQEVKTWQAESRKKLSELIKFSEIPDCDFNEQVLESVQLDGYKRNKIVINTSQNIKMPFYVLIPDEGCKKSVLAIHGHGSDGKNVIAGLIDDRIKDKYEKYNYTYGLDLVKMGFVVYIPDLCGSGERRENKQSGEENIAKSSCDDLNFALMSLGLNLQSIIIHDLIRMIDYIKADKNSNSDEIACIGFSGGGLETLLLSAVDERISIAYVSGYFHGFKDTILDTNRCGCNFITDLWKYFDCGDFGAMISPRKLIIEIGKNDGLNGPRKLENVNPQIQIAKKSYLLYNKTDNLKTFVCDEAHKWYGAGMSIIKAWGESID